MVKVEIDREDLLKLMIVARRKQDELRRINEDEHGYKKAMELYCMIEKIKTKYSKQL